MGATPAAEVVTIAGNILDSGTSVPAELWHEYLHWTANTGFVRKLVNPELQTGWAETCFSAISLSGYTLRHLFKQRASDFPDRILFHDMSTAAPGRWSYASVSRRVREIAAVFHSITAPAEPRVAIFSDNCVAGACCDLACLFYDVLNTPLNVHFDAGIITDIFQRLEINIVVTDTQERCGILQEVARKLGAPLRILALHPDVAGKNSGIDFLDEMCKRLGKAEVSGALERRRRFSLQEVATLMFTSGSTGEPKGVSFSNYNLVTKRFARAAALPAVGNDEVLLCYLPLFHTFGRYLEMLGMIYWGGTYVFAGNPSFETMLALLPKVNPTGLVGVPLRWVQLRDRCLEKQGEGQTGRYSEREFRRVVGDRLRWGLSAAGYLDPKVFRFFIRNGVDLCSGFGMTEATGGITMTPPGKYIDNTHGLPLPGMKLRLSEKGELQISGHYVGRYFEDKGPSEEIPIPEPAGSEHWVPTGDLFRVQSNGYYELVDRIKDIYKNDRGQTIAPLRVEKEFIGVPGIKRTFLVGDGRAYNVLLIVPDQQDPIFQASGFEENRREYFRRIVSSANRNLAPYERVVNFAILERDFGIGEVTAKDSLNRRAIEAAFRDRIEELYRTDWVELAVDGVGVRIPRWFFRDLSILEDDVRAAPSGLHNGNNGRVLPLKMNRADGICLVGDLEYSISGDLIDLGLFARQPRLWIGNPSLISFCPCKDGWDAPLGSVSPRVARPRNLERRYAPEELPQLAQIRDPKLIHGNSLVCCALFCGEEQATEAVKTIGRMLPEVDLRWNDVLRRRLEALARHPDEKTRCLAYQVLLLDDPTPDYGNVFSSFVESGLSFLSQESIEAIANSRFERRQLEALRRSLLRFRSEKHWPADEVTREQFRDIFQLLINFVENHPDFHSPVRAELAIWSLQKSDQALADSAKACLMELHRRFESHAASTTSATNRSDWDARLVFDDEVPVPERRRIRKLLSETPFLQYSIMLAFEESGFLLTDVAQGGIWISRSESPTTHRCYRISVNMQTGKHFDLELTLGEDLRSRRAAETLFWWLAIAGHPYGPRVLSQPGCFDPETRARSNMYLGALTVWEKIRQYSSLRGPAAPAFNPHTLKKLLVPALASFFRGWRSSGSQIVPGLVSPGNALVPELEFEEGATIASLAGWQTYENPLSLVRPMVLNFFEKLSAHYPWCREQLDTRWIFDACLEGLGGEDGRKFLAELRDSLAREPIAAPDGRPLSTALEEYSAQLRIYVPMHVHNAIDRYREWKALNPSATASAREQTVEGLFRLYPLYRYPEFVRYYFYRHTFYGDLSGATASAFDRLLSRMTTDKTIPAMHLPELSDLQDALSDEDRDVFSRMVFPRMQAGRKMEIIKIDEPGRKEVIVSSYITDRYGASYAFREPLEPREVGQLYRYFFNQNIPMAISEQDHHYVLMDTQERVVGGICYQFQDLQVVQIEGIVVAATLQTRGVGSAMEEEFCNRMASQGIRVVRGHFLEKFYLSRGYQVNNRWGTLVKFLEPDYP